MPNFCAAPNCTRKSTQSDLAFFRFPRDPNRCQKWVENCRRYDLEDKTPDQLNKHYRLCAQHFEDSMICRSSPYRTVLRENAIPTIFDLTSHLGNPGRRRKRIKELSEEEIRTLKERKRTEMVFGLHHSFLMASKSFLDIDLLIALVRLHPELYDPQNSSYNDTVRRGKTWNQISSKIFMDWSELNPQQRSMKVREVQTQWRLLKDNFQQELNKQMRREFPPPGAEKPAFSHFKELLFLQSVMVEGENAAQDPTVVKKMEQGKEEEDLQVIYVKEEPPSSPDYAEMEPEDPRPTDFLTDPQQEGDGIERLTEGQGEEDPHLDFAHSLVPYLAQVPDSHQANLRMALTNLIFCYIENTQGHVPTVSPQLMRYISEQDDPLS